MSGTTGEEQRAPVTGSARPRVAWVTNDLPPASGGIQQFVANLLARTSDSDTLVIGPPAPAGRSAAAERFDRELPARVERADHALVPGRRTARLVTQLLAEHRPDVVVIGSLWPLGRIARAVRHASDAPVLALSHGAEAGLARGPGRALLAALARDVDLVTVISDFTAAPIARALGASRIVRLPPGVDPGRFARTGHAERAAELRAQWGIAHDALTVGCVARLVARKGQDVLLRAWPGIVAVHPGAHLVLVGEGPSRRPLARLAARTTGAHVVGPVAWEDLPAAYAALDVFAMPVRTRWFGLDVEGLGISLLEAQAAGLPVIVGTSGGAPETLLDGRTGTLVDGRDVDAVARAVVAWLDDAAGRAHAARLGPDLVERWSWDRIAQRFEELLHELSPRGGVR
jgi:phosphatidylinositol alpha-1,6-mannosyltransferase